MNVSLLILLEVYLVLTLHEGLVAIKVKSFLQFSFWSNYSC